MAGSLRELLRGALVYQLSRITLENGFGTTLASISVEGAVADEIEEFPHCNLQFEAPETLDSIGEGTVNSSEKRDLISLEFWIRSEDNLPDLRDQLRADVETLLMMYRWIPDESGESRCQDSRVVDNEDWGTQDDAPYGGFRIRLLVHYAQLVTDPTTKQ